MKPECSCPGRERYTLSSQGTKSHSVTGHGKERTTGINVLGDISQCLFWNVKATIPSFQKKKKKKFFRRNQTRKRMTEGKMYINKH
uniref:Uncharacterized protein n=1 Tax=Anguilla anguilla TaxID=7936 RepID=A0A0E9WS30_ANGAN